jgi:hypothetical protein
VPGQPIAWSYNRFMKLVGERRALAAAVFAFWFLAYGVLVLGCHYGFFPPDFAKAFAAIAGVYGLAFFALVAGYFWARWYAVGVGLYGVITSVAGYWQSSPSDREVLLPILLFIGGTHLAATLLLWGNTMSGPYDGQTAWREKLHMDESAVQRLGRSVIRAGVSLPFVLLYALAPKPGGAELVVSIAALALAGLGLRATVKLKTWGVIALGCSGALMLGMASADLLVHGAGLFALRPALAGGLLVAAAAPFLQPMLRWVAAR